MFYLSRPLIDAGQVDPRDELDRWRCVGVVLPAVYVQAIYSILVCALE